MEKGRKLLMTGNAVPHLIAWAYMVGSETGYYVFIKDGTNVISAILSTQIRSLYFTMQTDIKLKHTESN